MQAFDLAATTADEVVRVVRALGKHRYVASRLHLVHAFAYEAVGAAPSAAKDVALGLAWARGVLADPSIEADSRDPRLWRNATDDEVALLLGAFFRADENAEIASLTLLGRLDAARLATPSWEPFDETKEDETHPVLIDAGWELLPLAALDAERHKGAILAFGEAIDFDVARFEEENAVPPVTHLQELPAMGPAELLRGADGRGRLVRPLTVWTQGHATYHDYVLRGVAKAAKLEG